MREKELQKRLQEEIAAAQEVAAIKERELAREVGERELEIRRKEDEEKRLVFEAELARREKEYEDKTTLLLAQQDAIWQEKKDLEQRAILEQARVTEVLLAENAALLVMQDEAAKRQEEYLHLKEEVRKKNELSDEARKVKMELILAAQKQKEATALPLTRPAKKPDLVAKTGAVATVNSKFEVDWAIAIPSFHERGTSYCDVNSMTDVMLEMPEGYVWGVLNGLIFFSSFVLFLVFAIIQSKS